MNAPERIIAWVWDLPYPSKVNGSREWDSEVFPTEQDCHDYIRADLYDAQAAEIADLRRQLAEAREVKPLEWNGKPGDFYMFADTDLGMYEIGVEYGDEWFCDFTSHKAGKPIRLSNCQDGPTVPQAAAQADYTSRILSALKGAAK